MDDKALRSDDINRDVYVKRQRSAAMTVAEAWGGQTPLQKRQKNELRFLKRWPHPKEKSRFLSWGPSRISIYYPNSADI